MTIQRYSPHDCSRMLEDQQRGEYIHLSYHLAEIARLHALVKSAYEEALYGGMAYALDVPGADIPIWDDSDSKKALDQ